MLTPVRLYGDGFGQGIVPFDERLHGLKMRSFVVTLQGGFISVLFVQMDDVFIVNIDADHELETSRFDRSRLLCVVSQDLQEALSVFGLDGRLDVQGDDAAAVVG
jgi:hypothetical protein